MNTLLRKLAVCLAITFLNNNSFASTVIDRISAIVNNEIVTKSDLDSYKAKLKSNGLLDLALLTFKDRDKLLSDNKYLLDHLIEERLIDSEIKKMNLSIPMDRVLKEINSIASNKGISVDQLKQTLKSQGVSFSEYQQFIKSSLERRSLIDRKVRSQVNITDEDITSFYISKYGAKDVSAFEYHLAHILVLNRTAGKQASLDKIERAYKELQQSSDFSSVAEQFSEDPNFKAGGIMGVFKSGEMRKSLENELAILSVGQSSKIIDIGIGYQIVKVLKKSLTKSPKVEAIQRSIQQQLTMKAIEEGLKKWISEKKDNSFIRIN